jgi:L-rhamnose mutarotase
VIVRACFQLKVRPDRIEEYRARHAAVWPEMLRALAEAGWHNYSLFLRPDGLLIGYVETPSLEAAVEGMARTEVNARWQAEMAPFFEQLDGVAPDQGFLLLEEVFHLEDQLEQLEQIDQPHSARRQPDPTQPRSDET